MINGGKVLHCYGVLTEPMSRLSQLCIARSRVLHVLDV